MTIETFWTRVDKNGPVMRPGLTPCWTWLGDKTSKGYGMLNWPHLARTATGRLVRMYAHRFSYQLHHSKRMLREGRTQQRIANTFAVTREAISQISRGNNWAHIQ